MRGGEGTAFPGGTRAASFGRWIDGRGRQSRDPESRRTVNVSADFLGRNCGLFNRRLRNHFRRFIPTPEAKHFGGNIMGINLRKWFENLWFHPLPRFILAPPLCGQATGSYLYLWRSGMRSVAREAAYPGYRYDPFRFPNRSNAPAANRWTLQTWCAVLSHGHDAPWNFQSADALKR